MICQKMKTSPLFVLLSVDVLHFFFPFSLFLDISDLYFVVIGLHTQQKMSDPSKKVI
jgi:hypothetical protein